VNVRGINVRRLAITVIIIGCAAVNAGCATGSHATPPNQANRAQSSGAGSSGGQPRFPDPASVAQIGSRALGPRPEPGFVFLRPFKPSQSSTAKPFKPPTGTTDHVCSTLVGPFFFLPQPLLASSVTVLPQVKRSAPSPGNWFEYIGVYPAGQSARMEAQLRALLGRCGHFLWDLPNGPAVSMHATVKSLPGIGDSTTYVSMRSISSPPGTPSLACDWVLIRSGNTLITLDEQGNDLPSENAPNPTMTKLVKDAWQRYATGS
jgi:hypothetical protein